MGIRKIVKLGDETLRRIPDRRKSLTGGWRHC